MSERRLQEKIYAILWRLHPARFRHVYGDEALQLFRDRAREETGFIATFRLWIDLLADLAVSVPREYRRTPAYRYSTALPSFVVLKTEFPRRGALLVGAMFSLVTLAAFPASINHFGNHQRPRTRLQAPPAMFQATTAEGNKLDDAERRLVIQTVAGNLKKHYIAPEAAEQMSAAVLAHEQNGHYSAIANGPEFAARLTKELRDISHDMHLEVIYSREELPSQPPGPTPERLARYRKIMEQENCTFEKVEILTPNLGYLKINSFPDLSVCKSTATAAMAKLNNADALIFDLRNNGGGFGDTVMFFSAYLFDHPEYMLSPRENTTLQSWTRSPVPGSKLIDKPVYILTSSRTISAAEMFTYNMKMLKRATLIGETTRGAAHAGVFYPIDRHFGMAVYEVNPINPYSNADWEGTGVEPDIKVSAAAALETALKLARTKLPQR